jgi:hypothetical protein
MFSDSRKSRASRKASPAKSHLALCYAAALDSVPPMGSIAAEPDVMMFMFIVRLYFTGEDGTSAVPPLKIVSTFFTEEL